jgi:hypothetical protein
MASAIKWQPMIATDQDAPKAQAGRTQARTLLQSIRLGDRQANVVQVTELIDREWDNFLRGTELGHFQQSSLWAQARQIEGWDCLRVRLEQEERVVGGFQMLWRRTRFGRIGYIIKGPVLASETSEAVNLLLDCLRAVVGSYKLVAIVVQPPDFSQVFPAALADSGFLPDRLMNVISATCVVRLAGAPGSWEQNMGRSKKVEVRQAVRRGLTIREGDLNDIPRFFMLMSATCIRQRVQPNPSTESGLRHLVEVFRNAGLARLVLAESEGQPVACVLDLIFGRRATVWKKGWSGSHAEKHPNAFLAYQSLRWAADHGCTLFDFAGMGRELAEHVLAKRPLTEDQKRDRDIFHLELGAEPQLLPPALIYWRHPLWRYFYKAAVRQPGLAARLGRLAKRLGSA